ncbi:MAG: hypothetical protein ACHQD8_00575 [Chitinophagales bacterium]
MNKRIYFILLPVLAIIFSIICWKNNSVFFNEPARDLSITKNVAQVDFPYSSGVKKENKNRIKNAIRIKAWDDAAAINIFSTPDPVFLYLLFPRVVYGGYRLYELSAHFSTSGLRGPPPA